MNTAAVSTAQSRSIQYYRQKEKAIFDTIPGMRELRQASDEQQFTKLQHLYPDAAFALRMASNLFFPDREFNAIHLKAYHAILNGEPVSNVRFRYDYDLESYLDRHLWDD